MRIYEFGGGGYVANLTVQGESDDEIASHFEEAKRFVFEVILSAVGARDVKSCEPYER